MQHKDHLIWLDLEMSGLSPTEEKILEIATMVTDSQLNILAIGPNLVIKQPDHVLASMDDWNQSHHGRSGLIDEVKASTCSEQQAEQLTLDFVQQWAFVQSSPLCGNSIALDRQFLANYMPRLAEFFHYRQLDVSSFKILCQHWAPAIIDRVEKTDRHRALADVQESIAEMVVYRDHFTRYAEWFALNGRT